MIKLIILTLLASACLALNQVFIKLGIQKIENFTLNFTLILKIISNVYFWLAGIQVVIGAFFWFYILSRYELSLAYPLLVSMSYILVMLVSIIIFKENVSLIRWIGVITIIFGFYLVTR